MIDYRYHALSLAAVLFALVLGVLLGVAIGDSNLVSSAKSGVVHDLESEVAGARRQSAGLQERLAREQEFTSALYPLAVHELLGGRNVGLLFLGESSDRVDALVRSAVAEAGGTVTTVLALREPPDVSGIAHASGGTRYAALTSSPTLLKAFSELVGRQLVAGGTLVDHELIGRVRSALMSAFDGQLRRLEGLVVMRAQPAGMDTAEDEASASLETGLLAGAGAAGVPAVGVELSGTEPSEVPWYRTMAISSVDDLDQPAGQAALVYALAGERGTFGTQATATSLLPSVVGLAGQP